MSAKLLEHFDLLATAPDGVARLRELILTLAVQGKLVPQDPNDEPASVLLQRIRGEKDRLIAEGKIKRDKPLPSITDDEKPFALPKEWAWVRLGDVTNYGSPSKAQELKPETWVLDMEDIEKSSGRLLQRLRFAQRPALSDKNSFSAGDVLYGKLRPYLNKVLVADEDGVCTTEIIPFRCYGGYVPQYFRLVLGSPFFLEYVNARSYGMKMPRLGTEDARKSVIPLPALSEQSRIVSRVEELMRLCDALEAKRQLDATQHAQLLHTLLGTLTDSATPEELAANWQRMATHFDLLLDRPEAVDALEQTILQLAVRGLLVPQDPNDEPASDLLKRLRSDRNTWLAARASIDSECLATIKKLRGLPDADHPFPIPSNWSFVRLLDCCRLLVDCHNKTAPYAPQGIPIIRTSNIRCGRFRLDDLRYVTEETYDFWSRRCPPEPGDIMFTREAPMGEAAIIPPGAKYCLGQRTMLVRPMHEFIDKEYLLLALTEPHLLERAAPSAIGSTVKHLRVGDVEGLTIPLPPFAEQSRIVARVAELRQLCAELRKRLTASRTTQGQLAEALVECV